LLTCFAPSNQGADANAVSRPAKSPATPSPNLLK